MVDKTTKPAPRDKTKPKTGPLHNCTPVLPSPYYQVLEDEQIEKDRVIDTFDLEYWET